MDGHAYGRPAAIAPAPARPIRTDHVANGNSSQPTMPYTCQTCARRKVKCDKISPSCSTCRKNKLECTYQSPAPRRRKRALSGDGGERLARYERILLQHGLLPQDDDTTPPAPPVKFDMPYQDQLSFRWNEPETARTGKLLAGQGKSRYVDSNLWRNFGDDEVERMYDEEEEPQIDPALTGEIPSDSDPLGGAFMGTLQNLLPYHPTHTEAMILWKTHVENVEPICKMLHIPSTSKMVEIVSQQPATASKADECLLFAIYHFAVFSLTELECTSLFGGRTRAALVVKYHHATRQALVNAQFLKTTEMSVMQALTLFLLPCRYSYDPHTFWILTGVAVRIAQRMGLHRDGEKLGLPPFEVQMRRRLFYQVIPLDGMASQMSGTGIAVMPDTWDVQQPLNVNDEQIWPGMTEAEVPESQNGPTEMIFCLARSTIGRNFARVQKSFKDYSEAEPVIAEAEKEVEEKYIRYCDIINPLHFLTIGFARSAITAMRLRLRLPKARNQTIDEKERKELWQLAHRIIDTDIAAYAHGGLKKYEWHVNSFFAWGSWDSLIFILTTLRSKSDTLSAVEKESAWSKIEQVYKNHAEILDAKRALQIAFGRLTLKAWNASPSPRAADVSGGEPAFIATLRSLKKVNADSRTERQSGSAPALDRTGSTMTSDDPSPTSDLTGLFGDLPGGAGFDIGKDFGLDAADWMMWDQLIQDYQTQGSQQQQGGLV